MPRYLKVMLLDEVVGILEFQATRVYMRPNSHVIQFSIRDMTSIKMDNKLGEAIMILRENSHILLSIKSLTFFLRSARSNTNILRACDKGGPHHESSQKLICSPLPRLKVELSMIIKKEFFAEI